jgi:hypothetical protein
MRKIETFTNLPHYAYPDSVLQSVSHNANLLPSFAFDKDKEDIIGPEGRRDTGAAAGAEAVASTEAPGNNSSAGFEIHKPYSFKDKPVLYKLSKGIFQPSLCLFERVFGWKIRITTESEI